MVFNTSYSFVNLIFDVSGGERIGGGLNEIWPLAVAIIYLSFDLWHVGKTQGQCFPGFLILAHRLIRSMPCRPEEAMAWVLTE